MLVISAMNQELEGEQRDAAAPIVGGRKGWTFFGRRTNQSGPNIAASPDKKASAFVLMNLGWVPTEWKTFSTEKLRSKLLEFSVLSSKRYPQDSKRVQYNCSAVIRSSERPSSFVPDNFPSEVLHAFPIGLLTEF